MLFNKKEFRIWFRNKKVIQKVNWVGKLETPCKHDEMFPCGVKHFIERKSLFSRLINYF